MPKVGNRSFPYTQVGKKAALKAQLKKSAPKKSVKRK
jgi:hypothetical protein